VKDIRPEDRQVISVGSHATTMEALHALSDRSLLAVSVKDEQAPTGYAGFVDVLDIVSGLIDTCGHDLLCHDDAKFINTQVKDLVDYSGKNKFTLIPESEPLSKVVSLFAQGLHRIALVDGSGKIVRVVSQWDLVKYLADNPQHLGELAQHTVKQLGLVKEWVLFCRKSERALQGFQKMVENKISAIAVVDEIGHLVGNLSASDLRGLDLENFKSVRKPVLDFIKGQHGEKEVDNICTDKETYLEVIKKVADHHTHRLWVIDGKQMPIGVISLTDIIQALVKSDD